MDKQLKRILTIATVSLVVLTLVVAIHLIVLNRYVIAPSGDSKAYKLDRWTGSVVWIIGDTEFPVKRQSRNEEDTGDPVNRLNFLE